MVLGRRVGYMGGVDDLPTRRLRRRRTGGARDGHRRPLTERPRGCPFSSSLLKGTRPLLRVLGEPTIRSGVNVEH